MANQLSTYTHKQFFNAPTVQKALEGLTKKLKKCIALMALNQVNAKYTDAA
ncbi:TPA: hypothetical protein VH368_001097 [Streptococcus pyogenes]|nr:hypothetical protein [Streptococcus pyogenes]